MFSFGLIILVGLVGLVIAALALALNESTRTAGLVLGLILLLGCGMLAGVFFVRAVPGPAPTMPPPVVAPLPPPQVPGLPAEKPEVPATSEHSRPIGPVIESSIVAASTELSTPAESPPPTSSSPKPDWVDQPGRLHGTIYRTSVKSGLFVTRAECEKALAPKMRDAVVKYIEDDLGLEAAQRVPIDAELIKRLHKDNYQETVTSASVGPMQQVHASLEFGDEARAEFTKHWHHAVVADRLGRVGIGSGVVLGLLAVVLGYLRLDILTSGEIRGRLRLAAAAAILLVATGAAIARHVLQL